MTNPKPEDIQPPPPEPPPGEIQVHLPQSSPVDRPGLQKYNFKKRSFSQRVVDSVLRWWRLALTLVLAVIVLAFVGNRVFFPPLPPDPPLTLEDVRQALVEFADEEPLMTPYAADRKAVPAKVTEDRRDGRVLFGNYECNLTKREFVFPPPYLRGSGLVGRFTFENGRWKAKLGAPDDHRIRTWIG